ncbi:potentiating neddylation domain-containing protein [Phycomyces blakesleeanus]|uniref:Defective in cullin neddylation protein n=1 Tax=Phycomyces blakesleeanus TaxID=4837 RepID=A0ABR3B128_PHYBL
MTSMHQLGTDSIHSFKQKLPMFEASIHDPDTLKEIYRYTFGYAKNKGQKCMDVEVACEIWNMLLANSFPLTVQFVDFLREADPVRVINKDQWSNFFEFVSSVSDDLIDYDETSAWPVLFDEFVAWKREHR